jgi:hypothetical protein
MHMIIMTEPEANEVRALTANGGNRIEPRLIEAGGNAGQYAVPARVADDPAFSHIRNLLLGYPMQDVDPSEAFPPQEE